ncbi:MAG TPA: hypothetical protein PKE63_06820 [Lacibacter sp.]|nr:hypothetical protein [Lacibacter sp.]HMO88963.1 hypothetical protein [Lacibacter sp.]HMP86972.1 hypothetical protein [Lacibacter sp.]
MKSMHTLPQAGWKLAAKVSALGVSLVALTYGIVWMILNTLRFVVEVVNP